MFRSPCCKKGSCGQDLPFGTGQPTPASCVHVFDAGDDLGSAVEVLESEHRPNPALDRTVVLFDEIVQALGLAQLDREAAVLAPPLSMVTFSSGLCRSITRSKERRAAAQCRERRNDWPCDRDRAVRAFVLSAGLDGDQLPGHRAFEAQPRKRLVPSAGQEPLHRRHRSASSPPLSKSVAPASGDCASQSLPFPKSTGLACSSRASLSKAIGDKAKAMRSRSPASWCVSRRCSRSFPASTPAASPPATAKPTPTMPFDRTAGIPKGDGPWCAAAAGMPTGGRSPARTHRWCSSRSPA